MIYETLHLYISDERLCFEPVYHNVRSTLVIDRRTRQVLTNPEPMLSQEKVLVIHGILGILDVNGNSYLYTISSKERVGTLRGKDIYKLTGFRMFPIHLKETTDDSVFIAMMNEMMAMEDYYFSYSVDLTSTMQRSASDDRFFWNQNLCSRLMDPSLDYRIVSRFILPVICGFVRSFDYLLKESTFRFTVISRRSRLRAGTRYHSRGVDSEGNCSNFVETEQIVEYKDDITSFVQTRGSIPLFWKQIVDIAYKPKLVLESRPESFDAFVRHFEKQFQYYGNQLVINLINKTGYEQPLSEAFGKSVELFNDNRIRYIHFDFHKECSKMRWDRLSILMDAIHGDLEAQDYYHQQNGKILSRQSSVVRTNCIDCLDRTNVLQSVISKWKLKEQLVRMGVMDNLEPEMHDILNNLWADHANTISGQYSGTGALKTDFTRTGKRSIIGVAQDFMNSVKRYVKNHYMDGFRQDAFDLFLGIKFSEGDVDYRLSSRVIFVTLLMILSFVTMMLYTTNWNDGYFYTSIVCIVLSVIQLQIYSKDFVSYPKLGQKNKKM